MKMVELAERLRKNNIPFIGDVPEMVDDKDCYQPRRDDTRNPFQSFGEDPSIEEGGHRAQADVDPWGSYLGDRLVLDMRNMSTNLQIAEKLLGVNGLVGFLAVGLSKPDGKGISDRYYIFIETSGASLELRRVASSPQPKWRLFELMDGMKWNADKSFEVPSVETGVALIKQRLEKSSPFKIFPEVLEKAMEVSRGCAS